MTRKSIISIKRNSDNKYIHKVELEDKKWLIPNKLYLLDDEIVKFQTKFGMNSLKHLDSSISIFDKDNKEIDGKFLFNEFSFEINFNEKEFLPEIISISVDIFSEEDICGAIHNSKFDKIKLI